MEDQNSDIDLKEDALSDGIEVDMDDMEIGGNVGIINVPITMTEEEKKRIPRNLLTSSTQEKMMFAFEMSFRSFSFMFKKGIYKVFIVDWVRTFILGLISTILFLVNAALGNNITTFDTYGKFLIGICLIILILWLIFAVSHIASEIFRIDAYRRIEKATKAAMTIGADADLVFCPPCSKDCGLFTLKWILIDFIEVPVVIIGALLLSIVPFGNTFLKGIYHSLFAYRVIFIQKRGFCSYFQVYQFWKKYWELSLGMAGTFMIFSFIPFISIINLPFITITGVRMFYIIQYLESLGEFDDDEIAGEDVVIADVVEMGDVDTPMMDGGIMGQEKSTDDLKSELFADVDSEKDLANI